METKKDKKGFTLVEMIVAISIIAILSVAGLTVYTRANQKSRDGRRKADLEQIRSGLEMYRADMSYYPSGLPNCGAGSALTGGGATYLSPIPCDPQGGNYGYSCKDGCKGYQLTASLELGGTYEVYNP